VARSEAGHSGERPATAVRVDDSLGVAMLADSVPLL
jgi:hypothetical protein